MLQPAWAKVNHPQSTGWMKASQKTSFQPLDETIVRLCGLLFIPGMVTFKLLSSCDGVHLEISMDDNSGHLQGIVKPHRSTKAALAPHTPPERGNL